MARDALDAGTDGRGREGRPAQDTGQEGVMGGGDAGVGPDGAAAAAGAGGGGTGAAAGGIITEPSIPKEGMEGGLRPH